MARLACRLAQAIPHENRMPDKTMSATNATRKHPGLFISLEGPEGAGKSTQGRMLAAALRARGLRVLETREPGGTDLGEQLRYLVKHLTDEKAPCPLAELLMFAASRAQLVDCVIRPHLAGGGIVLCDRFADSTTVYQGMARGLDMELISRLHAATVGDCWPNLTLVLDLDVEKGFSRRAAEGGAAGPRDRIEEEALSFHQTVRQGFLRLAAQHPERFRVVSTDAPVETVHQQIMEAVASVLPTLQ